MALTQEEIRIRAGLDYSKVTAGLTSIRNQVSKLAADVPNRLRGILATNVFMAAAQLIEPLKQQIYSLFDLGDEAVKRYEAQASSVAEATKEMIEQNKKLLKSREDLNKTIRDAFFEEASNLDKQAILEAELATQREIVAVMREKIGLLQAAGAPSGAEQVKMNEAAGSAIKIEGELKKVRGKFSPEENNTDFNRRMGEQSKRALDAKNRRRGLIEEMQEMGQNGDFSLFPELQQQADAEKGVIADAAFKRNQLALGQIPDPLGVLAGAKEFFGPNASLGSRMRERDSAQAEALEAALMSFAGRGVFKVYINGIKD